MVGAILGVPLHRVFVRAFEKGLLRALFESRFLKGCCRGFISVSRELNVLGP